MHKMCDETFSTTDSSPQEARRGGGGGGGADRGGGMCVRCGEWGGRKGDGVKWGGNEFIS